MKGYNTNATFIFKEKCPKFNKNNNKQCIYTFIYGTVILS